MKSVDWTFKKKNSSLSSFSVFFFIHQPELFLKKQQSTVQHWDNWLWNWIYLSLLHLLLFSSFTANLKLFENFPVAIVFFIPFFFFLYLREFLHLHFLLSIFLICLYRHGFRCYLDSVILCSLWLFFFRFIINVCFSTPWMFSITRKAAFISKMRSCMYSVIHNFWLL